MPCLPAPTRPGLQSSAGTSHKQFPRQRIRESTADVCGFMSVRVAVIGVGALGKHHARIFAELAGADLVGIVDINEARARDVAAGVGVPFTTTAANLPWAVDAVTIAVPTESHLKVALPFLDRGTAVLVEKPLARDPSEA